ncbi:hypothetical protein ABZS88_40985 [Streptomyces sp. NPDC005480]|uniref:hypothetical protein n=1 Tax=Streptomyces sp. NPDC005480 TaxID=3154880 RepID=UPI0033AD2FE8
MARARTVQVLLAALAAALLALQLFAHGAPAVEAHAAEPAAAVEQASLCDGGPVESEEHSGHHWNRDRQRAEDLLAATATHSMAPTTPVPAAVDADGAHAAPPDKQRAPGNRSPAALQVFRC